jgi:hypothetical protein
MIIFGTRGYLYTLAMVNFICQRCHNPAAQKVLHRVTRFTLFFIPLFPVSSSYSTTCTFCGLTSKIDKPQAEQYVAAAAQQQAVYQQQPMPEQIPAGPMYPNQPPAQYQPPA